MLASLAASSAEHYIPTPLQVKVALCQLAVSTDKAANLDTARAAINDAASAGAELVILPEMWNCPYSNDSFPTYAEDVDAGDSLSTSMLSSAAATHGVVLVGGSIPERSAGRLFNTCFIYGRDGRLLGRHRKVHLFDIDIPGGGTGAARDRDVGWWRAWCPPARDLSPPGVPWRLLHPAFWCKGWSLAQHSGWRHNCHCQLPAHELRGRCCGTRPALCPGRHSSGTTLPGLPP